jgi:hypothetical protein
MERKGGGDEVQLGLSDILFALSILDSDARL